MLYAITSTTVGNKPTELVRWYREQSNGCLVQCLQQHVTENDATRNYCVNLTKYSTRWCKCKYGIIGLSLYEVTMNTILLVFVQTREKNRKLWRNAKHKHQGSRRTEEAATYRPCVGAILVPSFVKVFGGVSPRQHLVLYRCLCKAPRRGRSLGLASPAPDAFPKWVHERTDGRLSDAVMRIASNAVLRPARRRGAARRRRLW